MDSNGDIIESPRGGQALEAWASSCAEMEHIDSAVAKKIMTGSFDNVREAQSASSDDDGSTEESEEE